MNQKYNLRCVNEYGEVIMSLLTETVTLKGANGTAEVTALFDGGASYSCIRAYIAGACLRKEYTRAGRYF